MGKTKIFAKRKRFFTNMFRSKNKRMLELKKNSGIRESNPTEELLNDPKTDKVLKGQLLITARELVTSSPLAQKVLEKLNTAIQKSDAQIDENLNAMAEREKTIALAKKTLHRALDPLAPAHQFSVALHR